MYLGIKQKEWLFLTCHNYWVVCHLVKDNNHPFLVYSSMISIEGSSQSFQLFLGAILSVTKGISVNPSTFNLGMELDTIIEDKDPGSLSEDDDSGGIEEY